VSAEIGCAGTAPQERDMTTQGISRTDEFSDAFDRGADALASGVSDAVLGRVDAAVADPIVQAILAADRVAPGTFLAVLREAAARLLPCPAAARR
jgi:hypothetical protein